MKIKSSFNLEKKLISQGYGLIIGIDEAGRGPLAGPIVAAAVALRNSEFLISNFEIDSKFKIKNSKLASLVRDSKTLSEKQRESLYDFIQENFYVGVGICDHRTIDRINILEATFLAMKCAISSLSSKLKAQNEKLQLKNKNFKNTKYKIPDTKYIILVDGNKIIPNCSFEQRALISGDKIVKSISAASIIAKVTRDRMMREYHKKYPEYDFAQHKGYGTALHMEKLKKHGPSAIHRRSFRPVKLVAGM